MARTNPKRAGFGAPANGGAAKKDKPKKSTKRAWDTDYKVGAADFFSEQLVDAEAKNGAKVYVGTEAERAVIGLPLKALSLQYVHSSDTYPLGRMEMIIGESDSCKTAFLFEKFRWFLREPGGGSVYELNEARDPSDLRTSIIGEELLADGRFRLEGPCASLENWQRNITNILHKLESTFKSLGGCSFPFAIGLDSITGTTNEKAIDNIDTEGCAKLTFGQDANLLNQYAKYLFQRLYPWPLSFICTNHIKYGSDRYGNRVMRIPGGDELRYVSTYITHLTKVKNIDRLDVGGGREIKIKAMKSMGDHRDINVEFVWWFNKDTGKQTSRWDWHGATVALLNSFSGERRSEISDICDIVDYNKTSRTAKCPAVGIKKSEPFDVVGQAIMQSPMILTALQNYFGIKRRRAFLPNIPYSKQIEEAIKAGDIETHNTSDIEGVDNSTEDNPNAPAEAPAEVPVDE